MTNLAHKFVHSRDQTVANARKEYDDACIDLAGDMLEGLQIPGSKLAYFETPYNGLWRYHAAVEVDGWIHDLWFDDPMPLKFYMRFIGASSVDYTAEIAGLVEV